jgi:hypothetical protein
MTIFRAFLNDSIPDCGVAACCNAIVAWGGEVEDSDAQLANDRFSAADYASKVLWGWWWRGIGENHLGGFATIQKSQIPEAVRRFGCAYVVMRTYKGVGPHAVLPTPVGIESWGRVDPVPLVQDDIDAAFAIAPRFHPILIWWALTNNPRWFLFLAPLWWPQ